MYKSPFFCTSIRFTFFQVVYTLLTIYANSRLSLLSGYLQLGPTSNKWTVRLRFCINVPCAKNGRKIHFFLCRLSENSLADHIRNRHQLTSLQQLYLVLPSVTLNFLSSSTFLFQIHDSFLNFQSKRVYSPFTFFFFFLHQLWLIWSSSNLYFHLFLLTFDTWAPPFIVEDQRENIFILLHLFRP